jgi:hypothetical protein
MLKISSVLLTAALAGCASTPISQGGKSEILFASNDTFRIRWNPQLTSERDMRSLAIAFCGGRDVDEVHSSTGPDAPQGLQEKTWQCKVFPGVGAAR